MDSNKEEYLTKNEFIELIPHLPAKDLLNIEYYITNWRLMIQVKDAQKKIYACNLCAVPQCNLNNLYSHIDGKKHKLQMQQVKHLFHADYTQPKAKVIGVKTTSNSSSNGKSSSQGPTNQAPGYTQQKVKANPGLCLTEPGKITSDSSSNIKSSSQCPKNGTESHTQPKPKADVGLCSTQPGKATSISSSNIKSKPQPPKNQTPSITQPKLEANSALRSSTGPVKTTNPPNSNIMTSFHRSNNKVPVNIPNISTTQINKLATVQKTKLKPMMRNLVEIATTDKSAKPSVKLEQLESSTVSDVNEKKVMKSRPLTRNLVEIAITGESTITPVKREEMATKSLLEENQSRLEKFGKVYENKTTEKNTEESINKQPNDMEQLQSKSVEIESLNDEESVSGDDRKKDSETSPKLVTTTSYLEKSKEKTSSVKQNDSEVIVIDDDEAVSLRKTKPSTEPVDISVVDPLAKKQKFSDDEPLAEKHKIVVNPAAVFLEKSLNESSSQVENDMPRYQSNIILTPTVYKNNINDKSKSGSNSNNDPTFSKKTFSLKSVDNDVHGLIGVEYVIKILKTRKDMSPKYECGLCELVLDGSNMQNHLIGYNHRLKFCEKHFPTAIRQFRQYMSNVPEYEIFKVMAPILSKLAVAIEKHHGRDLPYECLERNHVLNRNEILSKVFSCRHASEQNGPTFTHVIDAKEVDELINNRNTYKPIATTNTQNFDSQTGDLPPNQPHRGYAVPQTYQPYVSFQNYAYQEMPSFPNAPTNFYNTNECYTILDNNTHKQMVDNFLRDTIGSTHRSSKRWRSRRSRSRSPIQHYESRTKRMRSISPLRENDIWQAYRHLVDRKLNELDEKFEIYRMDPEKHPLYDEEWKKFWKRRKADLIAAGLDHRTYNYQPEWVQFFNIRLEELYTESVRDLKVQCRERLCLPMTNDELINPKYHVNVSSYIPENSTDDELLNSNYHVDVNRLITGSNSKTDEHFKSAREAELCEKKTNIDVPQVIPVLRLLTALEENLGSLGPKIVELLSKALQTEKSNPQKVNNIILTVENCTLLETAMEKFKGLLITGLLEGSKVRALKQAIVEIKALLLFAGQERNNFNTEAQRRNTDVNKSKRQSFDTTDTAQKLLSSENRSTNDFLSQENKQELAIKLAASLNAQGKSNYDSEQLQKIVKIYTILEKKRREATQVSVGQEVQKPDDTLTSILSSFSNSQTQMLFSGNKLLESAQRFSQTESVGSSQISNHSRNDPYSNDSSKARTSNTFLNDSLSNAFVSYPNNTSSNPMTNSNFVTRSQNQLNNDSFYLRSQQGYWSNLSNQQGWTNPQQMWNQKARMQNTNQNQYGKNSNWRN